MEAYIQNGDASAKPKLAALAATYAAIAKDLAEAHVPPSLASGHLILLQSYDTLSRATALVANYETDPVAVLGALSIYQPAAGAVVSTLTNLASVILQTGEPQTGMPGVLIVNFARSVQS